MLTLSSTSVRKSNLHLQINEEIRTSFQLKMILQFLYKKSSRQSSLNRKRDLSDKSNVLSMHHWVFSVERVNPECATPIAVTYARNGSYSRFEAVIESGAGGWIYSSRYSWSYLIKRRVETEHWMMAVVSANVVRIRFVPSKLKSSLEQLQMNEYRCAL